MEKQIVHVNGKAYDAVSGRRIDDIIAPQRQPKPTAHTVHQVAQPTKPTKSTVTRATNHTGAHKPQHAKTLMRHAVTAPTPGLKKQMHPVHALTHEQQHVIPVKHAAQAVDSSRLHRAQHVEKNEQVRRFHSPSPVKVTFTNVPVQSTPQDIPGTDEPAAAPPPTPTNKPVDLFEQAVENANHYVDVAGHKVHMKKKARRHALSMVAGVFALFIIAGFALYQNSPGVQIKFASVRAGVATNAPNFAASGFAYAGAHADKSRLVIGMTNAGVNYTLTEQATNLSSEEMIDHVSAVDAGGTPNYTTVNAGASTVYRLGGSQATWVKDGVWYNVHSNQGISDQQLQTLVQNT